MSSAFDSHRELSPESERFARYLAEQPFASGPLVPGRGMPHLHDWSVDQPVPLLVGTPFLERLEEVTRQAGRLIVGMPLRLVRAAPSLAARFWGMTDAETAVKVLDVPSCYDDEVYRLDLMYGDDGFRILEANMGAGASGFYAQAWLPIYLDTPVTAQYLERQGLSLRCKDTVGYLFDHVAKICRRQPDVAAGGRAGLAMLVDPRFREFASVHVARWFAEAAQRLGMECVTSTIVDESELTYGPSGVTCNGQPVHVLVRNDGQGVSRQTFAACTAGHLVAFDGPTSFFSGDKRTFALMTAMRDDAWFTRDEIGVIDALIPWTSLMLPGPVRFEDAEHDLRELALSQRERFVLKPARDYGGRGVVLGRYSDAATWQARIDAALGDHQWLLQQCASSKPYVFHHPETGYSDHDVVWGAFIVGGTPAGGTIRMKPRSLTDGVINVGRAGQEGLFCLHD
ncbi:hypothetical protein [Tahibacter amnicola]|uniref:Circularly permuted ATP-grasp superfamily protein n=1 Tax=Tahibacter amnicola TaxID=2976241 RepID=A0ABY6B9Q7_9GAMM|nr:hypothetical protein [Tahibacter amnicola]UXI66271.1 hypothetical protein N4264_16110 [Tahibacter amnicola]